MNVKNLPVLLFHFELNKARLKIAELSARSAMMQIYETVCQNLVMAHFKVASASLQQQSNLDLNELSGMILQAVRDLKTLSKRSYAASGVESDMQLLDLLKAANDILNLGLLTIKIEGSFGHLRNTDFLCLFITLHDLLTTMVAHKRKPTSLHIYGSNAGSRCVINYTGYPIDVGRLMTKGSPAQTQSSDVNFQLLRAFSGKVVGRQSKARRKSVHVMIPLLTAFVD